MPNTADDRNAIARSIVLALVMALLAGGGIAAGGYWFWTRPVLERVEALSARIETLRKSQSAHFGDVKALLQDGREGAE